MMKIGKPLSGWREEANYFSGKASESLRTLALGGLATVWLFKRELSTGPSLDPEFLPSVAFLSLALGLDLMHYVVGALIWHYFLTEQEKKKKANEEKLIVAPNSKRVVVDCFFYAKVGSIVIAYVLLSVKLIGKVFQQ